jgi:hypothetical protein
MYRQLASQEHIRLVLVVGLIVHIHILSSKYQVAVTTSGVPTPIPIGTAGILLYGVSLYEISDGQSYNNMGVWLRYAFFFEAY